MDSPEPPLSDPHATLDGWKEIAAYLGKSVRAAQRWERDVHLPVHRIKAPTGQVVYAHRAEIEAWRGGLDVLRCADSAHSCADPSPTRRGRTPIGVAGSFLCGLLLAAGAWAITEMSKAADVVPETFVFTEDSLKGIASGGGILWTYSFDGPVHPSVEGTLGGKPIRVDLDGDGADEVLAVVRPVTRAGQEPGEDTLYCLSQSGRLLWKFKPSLKLTFEGRPFAGPWRMYAIAVSTNRGPRDVWLSFGHHTWWPSAIVQIDHFGNAVLRYVQSGAIYALAYWPTASGTYVVAGGVNNEYAKPSLALIEPHSTATSPQHKGTGFLCDECPAGTPLRYLLFPALELQAVGPTPYGWVQNIVVLGDELKVTVVQGEGSSVHSVGRDLSIRSSSIADKFWKVHDALEGSGMVHHRAEDCPDLTAQLKIREWSPDGGWRDGTTSLDFAIRPGKAK